MPLCENQSDPRALSHLCGHISVDHPFSRDISQFREKLDSLIAASGKSLDPLPNERMLTRTLLRANRGEPLSLKWAYFSAQYWLEDRFRAWTFLYRAERGKTSLYEFPCDPRLSSPAAYLEPFLTTEEGITFSNGLKVLRYVPRRRLTFLAPETGLRPQAQKQVGKFIRPFEVEPLWRKLKKFQEQIGTQDEFQIARVTELCLEHNLFFQTHQPGTALPSALSASNFRALLKRVGNFHARIHNLPVEADSIWKSSEYIESIHRDVAWIRLFHPEAKSFLENILSAWLRAVPGFDESHFAFCHGDFRAPHLLTSETQPWSVIDFDGYLHADPCWEMALFLTSLKRDVPLLCDLISDPEAEWWPVFERAEQAYLEGYALHAAPGIDLRRLSWFRLGMEIHYLARSLQRDLVNQVAFERTWKYVESLAEQLA